MFLSLFSLFIVVKSSSSSAGDTTSTHVMDSNIKFIYCGFLLLYNGGDVCSFRSLKQIQDQCFGRKLGAELHVKERFQDQIGEMIQRR